MWSEFEEQLARIEAQLPSSSETDIPRLFSRIPLDDFGRLLLDVPPAYPHIRAFFPTMPPPEVQDSWTGSHGEELLRLSLDFVKTLMAGYAAHAQKKIDAARILDFGCGWGRIIRLLYKYAPAGNIYGVDPWEKSLQLCHEHGLKGHLALSDWVPERLPFDGEFDLVFALSVFTHLSEKTCHVAMSTLRKRIARDGVLLITIRPKEYWSYHNGGTFAEQMLAVHDERGFAFVPHNRPPVDGDITYGDASISLEYLERSFPEWRIESVECNWIDSYQILVFLSPAQ